MLLFQELQELDQYDHLITLLQPQVNSLAYTPDCPYDPGMIRGIRHGFVE